MVIHPGAIGSRIAANLRIEDDCIATIAVIYSTALIGAIVPDDTVGYRYLTVLVQDTATLCRLSLFNRKAIPAHAFASFNHNHRRTVVAASNNRLVRGEHPFMQIAFPRAETAVHLYTVVFHFI